MASSASSFDRASLSSVPMAVDSAFAVEFEGEKRERKGEVVGRERERERESVCVLSVLSVLSVCGVCARARALLETAKVVDRFGTNYSNCLQQPMTTEGTLNMHTVVGGRRAW